MQGPRLIPLMNVPPNYMSCPHRTLSLHMINYHFESQGYMSTQCTPNYFNKQVQNFLFLKRLAIQQCAIYMDFKQNIFLKLKMYFKNENAGPCGFLLPVGNVRPGINSYLFLAIAP